MRVVHFDGETTASAKLCAQADTHTCLGLLTFLRRPGTNRLMGMNHRYMRHQCLHGTNYFIGSAEGTQQSTQSAARLARILKDVHFVPPEGENIRLSFENFYGMIKMK